MGAAAEAMMLEDPELAVGVWEFRVGNREKRNAWKRDGRRTRVNAQVGDKRRVWAGRRGQEMEDGKRVRQRRGKGSEEKRRRARVGGAAGEDGSIQLARRMMGSERQD